MMVAEHYLAPLLVLILCSGFCSAAPAPTEYEVKAAFLYKFCTYAEWPNEAFADDDAPFVIVIAGPAHLVSRVRAVVNGRTIAGRSIAVHELEQAALPSPAHLLFIARSEHDRTPHIVAKAGAQPVLVVTEAADGLTEGSAINFVVLNGRVRFDIALNTAHRQGVRLSAQLLRVARRIHNGTQP